MMELCPKQETCGNFSNGTKNKEQYMRKKEPCGYWQFNRCAKQGDACEIKKAHRMRGMI